MRTTWHSADWWIEVKTGVRIDDVIVESIDIFTEDSGNRSITGWDGWHFFNGVWMRNASGGEGHGGFGTWIYDR